MGFPLVSVTRAPVGAWLSWIGAQAEKNAYHLHTTLEQRQIAKEKAIQVFTQGLVDVSKDFHSIFNRKIQFAQLTQLTFEYFFDFLESKYQLLETNLPENKEVKEKWKAFCCDIADLRYAHSPELKQCALALLTYLKRELERIDQVPIKPSDEALIWRKWEDILAVPDLLDLPLSILCKKVDIASGQSLKTWVPTSKHSIEDLQRTVLQIGMRLSTNFAWTYREITALLIPILRNGRAENAENCKKILEDIKKFKQKHANKIPLLSSADFANGLLTSQLEDLLNDVTLLLPDNYIGLNTLGNISDYINILDVVVEYIKEVEVHRYPTNHRYHLGNYCGRKLSPHVVLNDAGLRYPDMTLSEIEQCIEELRIQQKCHVLFDTYVMSPLSSIKDIWTAVNKYNKSHRLAVRDSRSIEELTSWIEGADARHSRSKKTNKNKEQRRLGGATTKHAVSVQKESKTAKEEKVALDFSHSCIETRLSTPAHATSSLTKVQKRHLQQAGVLSKTLQTLLSTPSCQLPDYRIPRAALRQSLMYLNDLSVVYRAPRSASVMLMPVMTLSSAAYYHMEQWLRYHLIMQREPYDPYFICDEHNLKMLLKQLSLDPSIDQEAPRALYLANFWTFHLFEQSAAWDDLEMRSGQPIPPCLRHLLNVQATLDMRMDPLEDYFRSTITFSNALCESKKLTIAESVVHDSFQEVLQLEGVKSDGFEAIDACLTRCMTCLNVFELQVGHPALLKLKQAHLDLRVLKEIKTALNQPKWLADEFSTWVRGAIYWQNGILENLLQAIWTLKSGEDLRTHDLAHLYDRIEWKSSRKSGQENAWLKEVWSEVNNFCRYPYEYAEPTSATHELILQAEMIRERPEIGLGFTIAGHEKKLSSRINFIPVSSDFTPQSLFETLNGTLKKSFEFMNVRLLPELELEIKQIRALRTVSATAVQ